MNDYTSLLEEPEDYIKYYRRNSQRYIIYSLLLLMSSLFIMNCIVFIYYFPKEINGFKENMNSVSSDIEELKSYEKKLDIMQNESALIYNIIVNLCKNSAISSYCNSSFINK
jgi:hypothetical protein